MDSDENFDKTTKESEQLLATALKDHKPYKDLAKKRSMRRQLITKTISKIQSTMTETEADISFYLTKVNELKVEICDMDIKIEAFMLEQELWSDAQYLKNTEICEGYTDRLSRVILSLDSKLTTLRSMPAHNTVDRNSVAPKLRLPELTFPIFDGKPEKYRRFIDSLDSILSKFDLTDFQKYSYLHQQVRGSAKSIVESLPDNNLSYAAAKELLEDAFSDETVQQFSVIESLSKLRLGSSQDFYAWISEVRQLCNQVDRLAISSAVFLQFFVWKNMSESYKKQFISVTNCAMPSINNIVDNAFEVAKRMNADTNNPNSSMLNAVTLATKVDHASKLNVDDSEKTEGRNQCGLCSSLNDNSSINHKIYMCKKFPTPESKLKRLEEVGGCTRCGMLNHKISSCKYHFNGRCVNCKKFHANFLCVKNSKAKTGSVVGSKPIEKPSNDASVSFNAAACATETIVMNAQTISSNVILPTFSANLPSNTKGQKNARVLYDPASQSTFISSKLLSKVKSKVINSNVITNIVGFNGSKSYKTKVVEVEVVLGSGPVRLSAVVVPEIGVKPNTGDMTDITRAFKRENILLADKHLNDNQNIEILLGADNAHLLPVQSCRFGDPNAPALVYYCSLGVMLLGSSINLAGNQFNLHLLKKILSKFDSTF